MSTIATFLLFAAVAHNAGAALQYQEVSYGAAPHTELKRYLLDPLSTVAEPEILQRCEELNGYWTITETTPELNKLIAEIESDPQNAGRGQTYETSYNKYCRKIFPTGVFEISEQRFGFKPISLDMKRFLSIGSIPLENVFPSLSNFPRMVIQEDENNPLIFSTAFLDKSVLDQETLSLSCEGYQ